MQIATLSWGANLLRQFAPCWPREGKDFKENQRVVLAGRSIAKLAVSDADKASDTNLGNAQVRDRRFQLGIEVGLNFTSVQFNDKRKTCCLLVNVVD